MASANPNESRHAIGALIVATLGYFVDVYDLIIFSVVRVASLRDLGLTGEELISTGVILINCQMAGMLLGGLLWGVLGDRRGRVKVLLGSIIVYSLANLLNGFVATVEQYAVLRFIAGVGLAGELGAGITLVSELMPARSRGYGTTVIATVGVAGAVAAALVAEYLSWREAYILGGILGLALLGLRISVAESKHFNASKASAAGHGSLLLLASSARRRRLYAAYVLVGIPIWFTVGILVTFAPEFSRALEVPTPITAGRAVLLCYIGLVAGDLISGLLSQLTRSRLRIIGGFLVANAVVLSAIPTLRGASIGLLEGFYLFAGFAGGYWALFVSSAAEQFGTNLRATVTTSIPNFVRGAVIPVSTCFEYLRPTYGVVQSAIIVGVVCLVLAAFALRSLDETFGRDLDFQER